eukprot:CCRYP_010841-RA/>CCRYP_010841-RA protein AED:0.46 eAED:0.46 QI:50/1/1/1/0/0/2/57/55
MTSLSGAKIKSNATLSAMLFVTDFPCCSLRTQISGGGIQMMRGEFNDVSLRTFLN